jgi:demethylmenaquinone methyltransferase/2-methoxy-6-polyprenyl-1,4-benzoquinol methylase
MDLKKVYAAISRRYESTNHILTLGLDAAWRRAAVRAVLKEPEEGPWLDLCSGTGETASALSAGAPAGVTVISADFSLPMIEEGIRRRGKDRLVPVAASADALPFPGGTFGLVTVTFAARNLRSRQGLFSSSLREIRRVLKPGGRLVNLETTRPGLRPLRAAVDIYTRIGVGRLGRLLTGERDGYAYLSGSIRSFPGPREIAAEILEAGFSGVTWRVLAPGVVAVHEAVA